MSLILGLVLSQKTKGAEGSDWEGRIWAGPPCLSSQGVPLVSGYLHVSPRRKRRTRKTGSPMLPSLRRKAGQKRRQKPLQGCSPKENGWRAGVWACSLCLQGLTHR